MDAVLCHGCSWTIWRLCAEYKREALMHGLLILDDSLRLQFGCFNDSIRSLLLMLTLHLMMTVGCGNRSEIVKFKDFQYTYYTKSVLECVIIMWYD
jgi:hypothetical protein